MDWQHQGAHSPESLSSSSSFFFTHFDTSCWCSTKVPRNVGDIFLSSWPGRSRGEEKARVESKRKLRERERGRNKNLLIILLLPGGG